MKGRAEAYGHRSSRGDEREAPVVGLDYTYMDSEQEKEEDKGLPIVVMKDEKTKMITAKVAPSKEVDAHSVDSVRKALEQLGHRRMISRSDNKPAILALKEAVSRESELEGVLEEVPVSDHQASGLVKNAVKNAQGQFSSSEC